METTNFKLFKIVKIIQKRIDELRNNIIQKMRLSNKKYSDLTEADKIPYKAIQAQIATLEDFVKGEDLSGYLTVCVSYEHYCGAEGVKNAIDWIRLNNIIYKKN